VLGEAFRRFNRNLSDFFRAGCKGCWWLIGATVFMSDISSGSFVANGGLAYDGGWTITLVYFVNVLCFIVNAFGLAGWFRQLRVITYPEAIRQRFGHRLELAYSYFYILMYLPIAGLQLWSVAIFTRGIFGFDVETTIILVGAIMTIYAFVGGSWAIMAADFVQGLILFSLTILIAVLCLIKVGGIDGLFGLIRSEHLSHQFAAIKAASPRPDGKFGPVWLISVLLLQVFANNGLYYGSTRFYSAKDGRTARQASLLVAALMLVGGSIWFIPPIVGRLLYSHQIEHIPIANPAESAFAVTSLNLLPNGLAGLMLVAIFSVSMSSIQGNLNTSAAIFVRNALPGLRRLLGLPPKGGDGMLAGRLFTLAAGIIIIACGLRYAGHSTRGVWEELFKFHAWTSPALMAPMFLCLFIRRIPRWGPFVAMGAGLAASVPPEFLAHPWHPQTIVVLGTGVTTLVLLLSTLGWRREPETFKHQVSEFFRRMRTPVDFAEEVGPENDHIQFKIIGWFATGLGCLSLCILLAPNPPGARWGILFVSCCIGGVGLAMLRLAKRHRPSLKK